MSDPIKAGDLAIVVKWPCCGTFLGHPLKVSSVWTEAGLARCSRCWATHATGPVYVVATDGFTAAVSWLKKIDPPAIAEDTEQKEELHA